MWVIVFVCLEMLQKQGKKLRREGKDRWVDFTGKVITWIVLFQFYVSYCVLADHTTCAVLYAENIVDVLK